MANPVTVALRQNRSDPAILTSASPVLLVLSMASVCSEKLETVV
jgi:hypothetical protein